MDVLSKNQRDSEFDGVHGYKRAPWIDFFAVLRDFLF